MSALLPQVVNAISYSVVLVLIVSGFSLIYGTMGILNLAHGALYMFGVYFGLTAARMTNNWILGLLGGGIGVALVGLALERGLLSRLYKQVNEQVLLTIGIVYVFSNAADWVWGPFPVIGEPPSLLSSLVRIGQVSFPVYRLAIIGVGAVIVTGLWWLQDKTRAGAIIRAGMDDKQMTIGLGVNYRHVCTAVFCLGALLAGLGGFLGAPILGAAPETGWEILPLALVVVVVGGVGSIQGTCVGAITVGLIDTLGKVYFPAFASFTIYLALIVVLLAKPSGLLGRKA